MRCLAVISSSLLVGCASYPLPSDVTAYGSQTITRIMRCETRSAIIAKTAQTMSRFGDAIVWNGMTGHSAASYILREPNSLTSLKASFSAYASPTFSGYADTSVSYDFTIDSSEYNGGGFDLTFLRLLNRGSNSLNISAQSDRTRQVKRQYRNYDSFESLLNLDPGKCADVPRTVNLLYPAVGLKRIYDLVDDFVDQNQEDNLGSKDKSEDAEMNDTMVFTTKLTGNFEPNLVRTGILDDTVASKVNVNSRNYRQDVHTIIILLRLPANSERLPIFDANGTLVATQKQVIDERLQEIRRNNFQDDIRNISNGSVFFNPR